jgi:hypothetical protein
VWSSGEYYPACGQFYGAPHFKEFTKSAGSRRRALLRWVQIALKLGRKGADNSPLAIQAQRNFGRGLAGAGAYGQLVGSGAHSDASEA